MSALAFQLTDKGDGTFDIRLIGNQVFANEDSLVDYICQTGQVVNDKTFILTGARPIGQQKAGILNSKILERIKSKSLMTDSEEGYHPIITRIVGGEDKDVFMPREVPHVLMRSAAEWLVTGSGETAIRERWDKEKLVDFVFKKTEELIIAKEEGDTEDTDPTKEEVVITLDGTETPGKKPARKKGSPKKTEESK